MVCGGRKLPTRAGSDFSLSPRRSYGKFNIRDHVVTTHITVSTHRYSEEETQQHTQLCKLATI